MASSENSLLGKKLRSIRNSMGMSLDEVSAVTGVSKTMLSQIERGQSAPTIATVTKIANGLKIRFDTLLDDSEMLYDVKSIHSITPLAGTGGKILLYSIFPFTPTSGFDFFYCILRPGCDHSSETHKNGRTEYLMVSKGSFQLMVREKSYHLKEGEAIAFNAQEPHRYINDSEEDVILYFILSYQ